jgi:DNA polymerase-3 subunit gamma/tau
VSGGPDTGAAEPDAPGEANPERTGTEGAGGLSLVDVRRLWPEVIEATKLKRRMTWIHLTQNAQVVAVDASTLTLGFNNAGARESFVNGGSPEIVRQAAIDVIGADWRVEAIVDPGASAGGPQTGRGSAPPESRPAAEPPAPTAGGASRELTPEDSLDQATGQASDAPERADRTADASASAREAIARTRQAGPPARDARLEADVDAHRDDPDVESSGLGGAELVQRELGATVIEEIKHD